jgi:predicted transcriptional regulator
MKEDKNRHPTENKTQKPTPTPTNTSYGKINKRDRELLKHLSLLTNKAFNIKQYARENKIPRSSVYEMLSRLDRIGFAVKKIYDNHITEKGLAYVQNTLNFENIGVGRVGRECRKEENLSSHIHKFTMEIKSKKNFDKQKLENFGCKILENNLKNLKQVFAYFTDATITINPKKVIINIQDFNSKNIEESDEKSFIRVIDYIETLSKCGLDLEKLSVETGHWARIDDLLANFIYKKVDKNYYLELENGTPLYVDCSNAMGSPEIETTDKIVSERVNNFLNQIGSNDFDLNDINKIKESLGFITKLESSRLQDVIEKNKLELKKLELNSKNEESSKIPFYIF